MASRAATFRQQLGAEVAELLGGEYRFFRSRLELRADTPDGSNVVILSGSSQFSPLISLSFYFGRNFAAARRVEPLLGKHRFHYHIQQYSLNRGAMRGLPYRGPHTWRVDLAGPPPALASEVAAAIRGIADPFFARFSCLESARDALAAGDPWCFGGKASWHQLLLLDTALGDRKHFEHWARELDGFRRDQAVEQLARLRAAGLLP